MEQRLTPSIIGELLLGELDRWNIGVCLVTTDQEGNIVVNGENGHGVVIGTEKYIESPLDGQQVKDLEAIAEKANRVIEDEMDAL